MSNVSQKVGDGAAILVTRGHYIINNERNAEAEKATEWDMGMEKPDRCRFAVLHV